MHVTPLMNIMSRKWRHHRISLDHIHKYITYIHDQHLSDILYDVLVFLKFSVVTMSLLLFDPFLFFFVSSGHHTIVSVLPYMQTIFIGI